jgi:hypothetical protein
MNGECFAFNLPVARYLSEICVILGMFSVLVFVVDNTKQ